MAYFQKNYFGSRLSISVSLNYFGQPDFLSISTVDIKQKCEISQFKESVLCMHNTYATSVPTM